MITDDDNRWHYLAVKILPALLRGTTSDHHGDFYCLNCFHSYRTLDKLKKHERVRGNHDYCCIDMSNKHEKIKYLPGEKSLKVLFIVYVDLESLLKKSNIVKIIPKILTQRRKWSTNLQDTYGVQYAQFGVQKACYFYRGKILKIFVKTYL